MLESFKKSKYVQNRRNSARLKKERDDHERHLTSIDRIADAIETAQDQNQTDDDKRAFREKLTISLLVATVILTFVADAIFYATLRDAHKASQEQLRRLDSQLKSMAESSAQTERTISAFENLGKAAAEAVENTEKSVNLNRDLGQKQLRAYVSLQASDVTWESPSKMIVEIDVHNFGLSPAYNINATGTMEFKGEPIPPDTTLSNLYSIDAVRPYVFPGNEYQVFFIKIVSKEDISVLKKDASVIVACVNIEYNDVFRDTWHTEMCSATSGKDIIDAMPQGGQERKLTDVLWVHTHQQAE